MNVLEVEEMLKLINSFDPRRVVNDQTVEAWTGLFDDIEAEDAMRAVRDYYLTTTADTTLMPARIIAQAQARRRTRDEQRRRAENAGGTPCGRKGCSCSHTEGCEAGWIEFDTRGERGVSYDQVRPCPRCRGDVATIAASAQNRNHFQALVRDKSLRQGAADEHQSAHAWDD